ncbi:MAG: thiamine pyrophosphate-dependent enzyme [Candidatus Bathyarchaeia archaeon]
MAVNLKELSKKEELLASGHSLCSGCAAPIVVRQVLKAVEGKPIITNSTGCLEVATSIYPFTAWRTPWIHTAFENAAANASGIAAMLKVYEKRGELKEIPHVIAFSGDGGTFDIGFQALSGAFERGHNYLHVLYDNEAYMNTGIQRSGGTPHGAWTTTSQTGKAIPGKQEWKKPIARIMVEHNAPYVATVSPAYWQDLITKVRKGLAVDGPAFIHAIAPCPRGWRTPSNESVELARLAVQTCIFPLWECENGDYKLSAPSMPYVKRPERKKPIIDYLKAQGRFRHLFRPERPEIIERIQKHVDKEWDIILKRAGLT